jgi:ubiquinone/menaquinone biosynthesis C-methylase UbiE
MVLFLEISFLMKLPYSSHALNFLSFKTKTISNSASVLRMMNKRRRRDFLEDMGRTAASSTTITTALTILSTTISSTVTKTTAHALTPSEASQAYDRYATTYDALDGGKASDMFGMDQARSTLLAKARGSVLEIGCGTGLNLSKYDFSKVSSLTLLDVSVGMLQQAQQRVSLMEQQFPNDKEVLSNIRFVQADATSELVQRFGTTKFDTVVDTFSFCVMGNKGARDCLQQMKQVVTPPHGQLLLLEHTRSSSNPWLGWYQDVTADTAAAWGGKGCVYNQDVSKMIQDVGGIDIVWEDVYAAGVFAGYTCQVLDVV